MEFNPEMGEMFAQRAEGRYLTRRRVRENRNVRTQRERVNRPRDGGEPSNKPGGGETTEAE
jgi:hypothetical protein